MCYCQQQNKISIFIQRKHKLDDNIDIRAVILRVSDIVECECGVSQMKDSKVTKFQ